MGEGQQIWIKHCENRKKLPQEHLISYWGVNLFLLNDVNITTVTTATVTTVTITSVTIWILSQFDFFSFVTLQVFEFCHNLNFWVLSQFVIAVNTFTIVTTITTVPTRVRQPGCLLNEGERADPRRIMAYAKADPEADIQNHFFYKSSFFQSKTLPNNAEIMREKKHTHKKLRPMQY